MKIPLYQQLTTLWLLGTALIIPILSQTATLAEITNKQENPSLLSDNSNKDRDDNDRYEDRDRDDDV